MAYYNYQTESQNEKAVLNMDDEILKIIKDLKVMFLISMKEWKLENAYWYLDLMATEVDAKLRDEEQKDVEKDLEDLEKKRVGYNKNGKEKIGEFYVSLKTLYKKINRLMKLHGVWFREQEDDEGL